MDHKTNVLLTSLAYYTHRENRSIGIGDGILLPGLPRLFQRLRRRAQPTQQQNTPCCQPTITQHSH